MNKKRVAVVGGGIAGLTCAYELQKAGFEVTVFEANGHVGGRMSSRTKDGLIFDKGADHLCDLYVEMKTYCAEFGIEWERMRFLQYGIFRDGKIHNPSDAISLFSKFRLAVQSFFVRDVGDFFNLNHLAVHDRDNAYDVMHRRTGNEVADYFVDAFTSTYQFHRAKDISHAAMLGIMRSIKVDQDRWYLHRTKGGMQALPNAFAERLNVRLNTPVMDVRGGEKVLVDDEEFDAAVLASEAPRIWRYYRNPTPEQRVVLESTSYASTISVAFRVDREKLPNTSVVWVPYMESRKISGYVNEAMKGEDLVRDGHSLISTWLHEDYADTLLGRTDEQIFEEVKHEFVRVCPWFSAGDELEHFDLERWPRAMPKFSHGHLKMVKRYFDGPGQGANNIYLCGDYLNSPWTEGALRCGQRIARQVATSFRK